MTLIAWIFQSIIIFDQSTANLLGQIKIPQISSVFTLLLKFTVSSSSSKVNFYLSIVPHPWLEFPLFYSYEIEKKDKLK